jgi:UPF0755 protein
LKFLLVVVVLVAAVVGFYVLVPYGPEKETFVEIAPGTGTAGIAKALERAGVVRSAAAFEAVKEWRGLSGKTGTLKAGEYRFDHAATVGEVYDRLRRGDVYTVTLVVPEGFNIFDIAAAVEAAGLGSKEEFLAAEKAHTELIAQWSPRATSLEGYLFPDTYKFGRHATAVQMLTAMVKRFGVVVGRVEMARSGVPGPEADSSAALRNDNQKGKSNGESVARLVTMASLVEKEVHLDGERPVVASVFRNRLEAGMPLQTDPAVIYASMLRGTWTGVIHQSELHSDSAYNTYAHTGLPPGPICSPGLAALKAAMHPADTPYLYFVADANGATRFAATLKEHDANVASYRKQEAGSRKQEAGNRK